VQPQSSLPSGFPPPVATSLDVISRSVAVFAILLYGCGYLITSIYYSGYGFTETSPLRPRIVAAGAWFLLFAAVPFALVTRVLKSGNYLKAKGDLWFEVPAFLYLYYLACAFLAFMAQWIFEFETDLRSQATAWEVWTPIAIITLLSVGCMPFTGAMLFGPWKLARPVAAVCATTLVAWLVLSNEHQLFTTGRFGFEAITLWMFGVGILAALEMRTRAWKMKLGDWTWSTTLLLGTLLAFASFYYPHIKSSWGGGRPIPVTIYFTKDSVIMPGQSVNALLIDESDSGLYVVGKKDKKATFIPHSSVGLVYFSDNVSDFSLSKPK
jgi:hypothetical protein